MAALVEPARGRLVAGLLPGVRRGTVVRAAELFVAAGVAAGEAAPGMTLPALDVPALPVPPLSVFALPAAVLVAVLAAGVPAPVAGTAAAPLPAADLLADVEAGELDAACVVVLGLCAVASNRYRSYSRISETSSPP
jgi:hypothetical protein